MIPLLFVTACTGGPADDTATDDDLRTLASCEATVDDDVPAFFQRYFRCADVSVDGDEVLVHTIGLPPHPSAYYEDGHPNHVAWDDRGGEYFQNPNRISAGDVTVHVPMDPTPKGLTITEDMVDLEAQTSDEEYPLGPVGVALDSVYLFNAVAAPGDDIRDEEWTFDTWSGHPTQTGEYHYHAPAPGPLEVLDEAAIDAEVYGILCDGTVVLGCTELDGSAPDTSDLDGQSGHVHDLTDEEGRVHFTDRYHAHVCEDLGAPFNPELQYYDSCVVAREL